MPKNSEAGLTVSGAMIRPSTYRGIRCVAASFVTPWNALNIVGLDVETGEVTVYWWAPETGEWRVERVEAAGAPEDFEPGPPLSAGVSPAGEQNIFVRSAQGELARLFWTADEGWRYESVTAGAAG